MNIVHVGAPVEHARLLRRLPPPAERRTIRERAGLSRRYIAAACGVTESAVQQWERGTRQPSSVTLRSYVTLLDELREVIGGEVA